MTQYQSFAQSEQLEQEHFLPIQDFNEVPKNGGYSFPYQFLAGTLLALSFSSIGAFIALIWLPIAPLTIAISALASLSVAVLAMIFNSPSSFEIIARLLGQSIGLFALDKKAYNKSQKLLQTKQHNNGNEFSEEEDVVPPSAPKKFFRALIAQQIKLIAFVLRNLVPKNPKARIIFAVSLLLLTGAAFALMSLNVLPFLSFGALFSVLPSLSTKPLINVAIYSFTTAAVLGIAMNLSSLVFFRSQKTLVVKVSADSTQSLNNIDDEQARKKVFTGASKKINSKLSQYSNHATPRVSEGKYSSSGRAIPNETNIETNIEIDLTARATIQHYPSDEKPEQYRMR